MEREQAYRHFLIIDVSLHMHPTDVGVVCKIIRERAIMGLKVSWTLGNETKGLLQRNQEVGYGLRRDVVRLRQLPFRRRWMSLFRVLMISL
jgi:hypothetical protein